MKLRIKILKRVHLTSEFYFTDDENDFTSYPFSIGFDLDTGGHLFQLIFSNSQSTVSKSLITDNYGNWFDGDVYFGFNLIRVFYIN